MILLVGLPLAASALLALAAPILQRRLAPVSAVLTLTGLAVLAAGCRLVALGLLAVTAVAALPAWASLGHGPFSSTPDRVPVAVALVAAALLLGHVRRVVPVAMRAGRQLHDAERVVRNAAPARLILLPDSAPQAFAVGGITGGRIAVSAGMLAALDVPERSAMLAHEQAHLDGHHHVLKLAVALAAAADPLLRRLPALVEQSTERWADETTATRVGDRRLVARALSRAALASLQQQRAAPGEAFERCDVPGRVRALLQPAPSSSLRPAAVAALLALLVVGATAGAARDVDAMLDVARATGSAAPG